MNLDNVVIETTRRCNLECAHCLRGPSEAIDMPIEIIESLFCQVDYIGALCFSGGEPSLPSGVFVIEETLRIAKEYGVDIGSFYIVTNGIAISERFIIACLRWFSYCQEKEYCSVQVSNDMWHAAEGQYDTDLLDGLGFFSRKHPEERKEYDPLDMGLANENGIGGREHIPYPIQDEILDGDCQATLYLNCNGEIITDCDLSYEIQEAYRLCYVSDLRETLKRISKQNEE